MAAGGKRVTNKALVVLSNLGSSYVSESAFAGCRFVSRRAPNVLILRSVSHQRLVPLLLSTSLVIQTRTVWPDVGDAAWMWLTSDVRRHQEER